MAYRPLDPAFVVKALAHLARPVMEAAPYYAHYLGGKGTPKELSNYFHPAVSASIDSVLADLLSGKDSEAAFFSRGYLTDKNPLQHRLFVQPSNYDRVVDHIPFTRAGAVANTLGQFDATPDTLARKWRINDPYEFHARGGYIDWRRALPELLRYIATGHTLSPLVLLGNLMGSSYMLQGNVSMTDAQLKNLREIMKPKHTAYPTTRASTGR